MPPAFEEPAHDPLIGHYQSLQPGRFDELHRLEVTQETASEGFWVSLEIELRAGSRVGPQRLLLRFEKVRNFRYTPPEACVLYVWGLDIVPLHDRQWEGLGYEVTELEGYGLSFLCARFTARLLDAC